MTSENGGFAWTEKTRLAAELVAEDRLTDEQIAEKVEVTVRTLYRWKADPVFSADVESRVVAFDKLVRSRGIARIDRRVAALDDRWRRMQRVIDERSADPTMAKAPGGSTGLLAHRKKCLGSGDSAEVVDEYEVDTGLLKALIDHEKLAGVELGQTTKRQSIGGDSASPVVVKVLRGVSMDDL